MAIRYLWGLRMNIWMGTQWFLDNNRNYFVVWLERVPFSPTRCYHFRDGFTLLSPHWLLRIGIDGSEMAVRYLEGLRMNIWMGTPRFLDNNWNYFVVWLERVPSRVCDAPVETSLSNETTLMSTAAYEIPKTTSEQLQKSLGHTPIQWNHPEEHTCIWNTHDDQLRTAEVSCE